jgi:quercetin dioxygenase-like cupin family protein
VEIKDRKDQGTARVGPGEGQALWVLGELVTYKVTAEQTDGAYSLFEIASWPGGGPPPHVQRHEDECFYVLEGEYEFLDDGRTTRAGAGTLIYVPKGTLHTYKNVGDGVGRMLVSQTPGGLHERFFEELGEPAADKTVPPETQGPPDVARIVAVAARYGIEIPPPPA